MQVVNAFLASVRGRDPFKGEDFLSPLKNLRSLKRENFSKRGGHEVFNPKIQGTNDIHELIFHPVLQKSSVDQV